MQQRSIVSLIVLWLLAAVPLAAWAETPTDAEVYGAVSAAEGRPVDKKWVGLERPREFPGLVLVGFFAHDRGYALDGVYFGGRYGKTDALMPDVLKAAGWSRGDHGRLARAWADRVLLAWHSTVTSPDKDFGQPDSRPFAAPAVVVAPSGAVTYTVWVHEPSGMLPQSTYHLMRYDFAPDGSRVTSKAVDGFTRSYR